MSAWYSSTHDSHSYSAIHMRVLKMLNQPFLPELFSAIENLYQPWSQPRMSVGFTPPSLASSLGLEATGRHLVCGSGLAVVYRDRWFLLYMTICNLDGVNPLDRNSWRTSVRCCLPRSPGQPQHLKYQNRIWWWWWLSFMQWYNGEVMQWQKVACWCSDVAWNWCVYVVIFIAREPSVTVRSCSSGFPTIQFKHSTALAHHLGGQHCCIYFLHKLCKYNCYLTVNLGDLAS